MKIFVKLFRFLDKNKKHKQLKEKFEDVIKVLHENRLECRARQQSETDTRLKKELEKECIVLQRLIEKSEKRLRELMKSFPVSRNFD